MDYHKYYSGPKKLLARTFRVQITGHLLPDDCEVVFTQNMNIRATNQQEAYEIAGIVRDTRLNRLYTSTTIIELHGQLPEKWTTGPGEPESSSSFDQDVKSYRVTVVREAGINPLIGIWTDQAEDSLTIHATSEQEAHKIADFVSALPFSGQLRRTIINGIEHFDEKY